MTKYIGAHFSCLNSLDSVFLEANKIHANAISFFIKNPRKWFEKEIDNTVIKNFKYNMKKYNFTYNQILPHASYLINLCNPNKEKNYLSKKSFLSEIVRCNKLGIKYINVHPGNYIEKNNIKTCFKIASNTINEIFCETENVSIILENTSGMGTSIGYKFEHLYELINLIDDTSRIGVCIDTCHLFSSGYDISNIESIQEVFLEFNKLIGFNYLKGIHLNDSLGSLGSKIDRHENLGFGKIGNDIFSFIIKNKKFDNIPIILETKRKDLLKDEILFLKSFF
ncbi:deoxyribonuclease IV [Buchnera aphidicola (Ceratovacuna keduensis)]|uniref:deoxyribonuclease IV n=1 Tax=Buchnera aphidicola TaxID=9 RepID=UPI0031B8B2DC